MHLPPAKKQPLLASDNPAPASFNAAAVYNASSGCLLQCSTYWLHNATPANYGAALASDNAAPECCNATLPGKNATSASYIPAPTYNSKRAHYIIQLPACYIAAPHRHNAAPARYNVNRAGSNSSSDGYNAIPVAVTQPCNSCLL